MSDPDDEELDPDDEEPGPEGEGEPGEPQRKEPNSKTAPMPPRANWRLPTRGWASVSGVLDSGWSVVCLPMSAPLPRFSEPDPSRALRPWSVSDTSVPPSSPIANRRRRRSWRGGSRGSELPPGASVRDSPRFEDHEPVGQ